MDKFCLYAILGLTFLIGSIVAMFLGYKVKVDKKHIHLEKKDQEHEQKHHHNEERIKELEKKNGHEQHQIDTLKEQVTELLKDKENRTKQKP